MRRAADLIAGYEPDSNAFVRANAFLVELHKHAKTIDRRTLSELRSMAIHGNIPGAWRGLERLVREYQGGGIR